MGLTLAYSSPTIDDIQKKFGLSSTLRTTFICISLAAGCVSGLIANAALKRWGKRSLGLVAGLIGGVSFVGLGAAGAKWLLFLMRVLNGASIGFFAAVCPPFLTEVAPPGQTGLYGFLTQIGCALGFCLATVFGFVENYRLCSYLCSIPSFLLALGILFVPEQGKAPEQKAKFTKLFKYKKELLIAIITMLLQQFSGINAILGNLQPIISKTRIGMKPKYVALIANVTQIAATVISMFLIDSLGYMICWVTSTIGQMLAFIFMFIDQDYERTGKLFMAGLIIEQFSYGVGTGPIPFSFASEIFVPDVREYGCSISTASTWLLAAVVCLLWPVLEDAMNHYYHLFFAAISLLAAVFGFFFIKKISYDEIDNEDGEFYAEKDL